MKILIMGLFGIFILIAIQIKVRMISTIIAVPLFITGFASLAGFFALGYYTFQIAMGMMALGIGLIAVEMKLKEMSQSK